MKRNGSGAVTVSVVLDPDAVRTAEAGGGKLEDRVRLSDLAAAHWTVSQWQRALDGSATITATKQFSRPSQVTEIIGEISGPNGPLRDFRATRQRELLKTEYRVSGTADLEHLGTGVKTDQELANALTQLGVNLDVLDLQLLAEVRDAFHLHVNIDLPSGKHVSVTPDPGKQAPVTAQASVRDTRRIALGAAAIALLVVGVALILWPRRRRRRGRGRRRAPPAAGAARRSGALSRASQDEWRGS